jgi:hypothetical protein
LLLSSVHLVLRVNPAVLAEHNCIQALLLEVLTDSLLLHFPTTGTDDGEGADILLACYMG